MYAYKDIRLYKDTLLMCNPCGWWPKENSQDEREQGVREPLSIDPHQVTCTKVCPFNMNGVPPLLAELQFFDKCK